MFSRAGSSALVLSFITASAVAQNTWSCRPGQPCWPTDAQFAAFNASIGGKLYKTQPYAAPCFTFLADGKGSAYNATQCNYVEAHYADYPPGGAFFPGAAEPVGPSREALYGACHNLQWETCGASDCLLQSLDPQIPPVGRNCSLGRLSALYVDARSASDVQATQAFTQSHNIKMTIKNTGADYLGRSTSANSLALWTHNMNNLQYYSNFTASDCSAANRQNVGVMGAGVAATDAYNYFNARGFDVVGGAVGSIGLAGGYGQGGGHGAFGPAYGLMVDNAVEFDVVTADNVYRTINQCNNPDLFFAMRGGGGSTYATLINYKFQLYPHQDLQVYSFVANFSLVQDVTNSATLHDLVTALANNQTMFSNNKIAGYNFLYPNRIETVQILPATGAMDSFKQITSAYANFLTNYPGLQVFQNNYTTYTKYSDFVAFENNFAYEDTPIGYGESLAGRLIPRELFQPANVSTLVNSFLAGMQASLNPTNVIKPIATQIYATGPANNNDLTQAGVNTAWRGSLWEVVYAAGWVQGVPQAVQDALTMQVHTAMDNLRTITPGGGCCKFPSRDLAPLPPPSCSPDHR